MNDTDFSPSLKNAITTAFNEALRQLIDSVHGIMPDNIIVLNTITALCLARRDNGFTEEQTRDEIASAVNQIAVWRSELGRKT